MNLDDKTIASTMKEAALEAGARIMEIYEAGFEVDSKSDGSPVTEADHAAHAIIATKLGEAFPDIPVVSEEDETSHGSGGSSLFFLVDPLDGTKEFVNRNGEFTVNIAMIEHGVPVLGVVYAPACSRMFYTPARRQACEDRDGSSKPIQARGAPGDGLAALVSRSHPDAKMEAYLEEFTIKDRISAGSSLKFCLIAAGEADIYPRFGRTMEWDTAAGDAVLRAAGGRVLNHDKSALTYGKPGGDNPEGFVAFGAA